jgi:hypothetical protein
MTLELRFSLNKSLTIGVIHKSGRCFCIQDSLTVGMCARAANVILIV